MKIAFFHIEEESEKEFYQNSLSGHEVTFINTQLNENNLPPITDYDIISVFVDSNVNSQVISSFPNLKLIVTRATGFDNIDLEAAKSKNIAVCNVPAYGSHTVAEFTFGLILSLSRNIPEAVEKIKESQEYNYHGLKGWDLYGKTIGVIGTGKIGSNVIKIAKGFEMNVLAYDAHQNPNLPQFLGFKYVSLDDLLANSDIVTVHVPALPDTIHLINLQNIFKIKKGAILINTSRGVIVETQAVYQAVTQNHLAGVALDVIEEEAELKEEAELLRKDNMNTSELKNLLQSHILMKLPNVIITPHMAFYTQEAENSIMQTTLDNINNFIAGNIKNSVS